MLLPAFSRRFATMLMVISPSVMAIAQSPASEGAEPPTSAVAPLSIPEVKLVEGAERTIMLADGTKIKVPEDLWKPRQLLNTSHGPVQLPGNLGSSSSGQAGSSRPASKPAESPTSNKSDGPPPKGERRKFRFEMPEPAQPGRGESQKNTQQPSQSAQPSTRSAATWKPRGIISMRNKLEFHPAPDGTLRTLRNANIRGDNGEMAASSQTRAMRSIQGMPDYLQVYYDAKTNGFYIDVVRQ